MRMRLLALGAGFLLAAGCQTRPGPDGGDVWDAGGASQSNPEESDWGEADPEEAGLAVSQMAAAAAIEAEVLALLYGQTIAWNEGDLAAFVADYLDAPRLRFVSGGGVRYGAADVLDRYRRNYPDRAAMGQLSFEELDVRVLSEDFVFVFGRYRLERESDAPTGLFTLLLERTPDGWKISHDHTSSE